MQVTCIVTICSRHWIDRQAATDSTLGLLLCVCNAVQDLIAVGATGTQADVVRIAIGCVLVVTQRRVGRRGRGRRRRRRQRRDRVACGARRGAVALSPILEPVAHLSEREAGAARERALLFRRRIAILTVAVLERLATLLFEAVDGLLAIPDGLRQRKLATYAVLVDGAERSPADLLRLQVMAPVPHRLQVIVMRHLQNGIILLDLFVFFGVTQVESKQINKSYVKRMTLE